MWCESVGEEERGERRLCGARSDICHHGLVKVWLDRAGVEVEVVVVEVVVTPTNTQLVRGTKTRNTRIWVMVMMASYNDQPWLTLLWLESLSLTYYLESNLPVSLGGSCLSTSRYVSYYLRPGTWHSAELTRLQPPLHPLGCLGMRDLCGGQLLSRLGAPPPHRYLAHNLSSSLCYNVIML